MAIIYPRPLPSDALTNCTFDLLDATAYSPSARGLKMNVSQTADPVWKASIASRPLNWMDGSDLAEWSAWKKSMRGGLKDFTAWDLNRARPLAYQAASGPADISSGWDGTATVSSVGTGGELGLSALPATYQAKVGDRIGLKETVGGVTYYGYYEALEAATASSGAVTLTVAPLIHRVFTTSAVATLWRPVCRFIIDWQSWQESGSADRKPFSFEAYQRL